MTKKIKYSEGKFSSVWSHTTTGEYFYMMSRDYNYLVNKLKEFDPQSSKVLEVVRGSVLVAGDLHLGHKLAAESRYPCPNLPNGSNYPAISATAGFSTVEDHDESVMDSIIKNTVSRCTLVLTGDIVFRGGYEYFDKVLEKSISKYYPKWSPSDNLPFDIKVVMGNHDDDRLLKSKYISRVYSSIQYKCRGKKVLLTHIPIHTSQLSSRGGRWDYNVHAHLHHQNLNDREYLCSSWEQYGESITLTRIITELESLGDNK